MCCFALTGVSDPGWDGAGEMNNSVDGNPSSLSGPLSDKGKKGAILYYHTSYMKSIETSLEIPSEVAPW